MQIQLFLQKYNYCFLMFNYIYFINKIHNISIVIDITRKIICFVKYNYTII